MKNARVLKPSVALAALHRRQTTPDSERRKKKAVNKGRKRTTHSTKRAQSPANATRSSTTAAIKSSAIKKAAPASFGGRKKGKPRPIAPSSFLQHGRSDAPTPTAKTLSAAKAAKRRAL